MSPWLAIAAGAILSSARRQRDHLARRALFGERRAFRAVDDRVRRARSASFSTIGNLVGGTGGYFLKAINPDTNRPLEKPARRNAFLLPGIPGDHRRSAMLIVPMLMESRWGYRWRALHEDEEAARALGVPALRSKIFVVAISAELAGIGGGVMALMQGSLFPRLGHGICGFRSRC